MIYSLADLTAAGHAFSLANDRPGTGRIDACPDPAEGACPRAKARAQAMWSSEAKRGNEQRRPSLLDAESAAFVAPIGIGFTFLAAAPSDTVFPLVRWRAAILGGAASTRYRRRHAAKIETVARLHAVARKPALIDLQAVVVGLVRLVDVQREWLHVLNIDYRTVSGNESDR